jgi:hypothetical protein
MNIVAGIIIFAGCFIFLVWFNDFADKDWPQTRNPRQPRNSTTTWPVQTSTYSPNPTRWHGSQTIIVPPELWHGTSEDNAIDIYFNNQCLSKTAPYGLWMTADFNTAVSYARNHQNSAVVCFDTSRITPQMAIEYESIKHINENRKSDYARENNFYFIVNSRVWIFVTPDSQGNQYYALEVIRPVAIYNVNKQRIY